MKVVTFGEILLRLSPEGHKRFLQAEGFDAVYGGGEANTAVSLAQFGYDAKFITKLPDHEIGQAAINTLRQYGVDTSDILRGGDRIGLYYLEKGAAQRPSKVIYDRAGSSVAAAKAEEFDWERLLSGAEWFHITGITPALSAECAKTSLEAVKTARRLGITVSCDINFRRKLWDKDTAGKVMAEILEYTDIYIGGRDQAEELFGIPTNARNDSDYEAYKAVAEKLKERFGLKKVAITLRTTLSSDENKWAALLYDGEKHCFSREYRSLIVDRVGGGDSFSAGLIYALGEGMDTQSAVDFAAAASCLKLSVEGDCNIMSADEVKSLAFGGGSAQVQR
ncbi:2-dehydro-3-deoxygluconokinase [Ruminococcus albus SY3]|uniref:2-dehydro-3-deoxygluconokinase n=1 Tax=Ruminococcus albus SY3 TaxID=1341156 RepID=A0A011WQJ3_RUMAL|nr:sugar kinase [Ruminococcus albus]EXM39290.1 2-dehydro-3-deoxygluconokinase [Ruminococcus albus SY3]